MVHALVCLILAASRGVLQRILVVQYWYCAVFVNEHPVCLLQYIGTYFPVHVVFSVVTLPPPRLVVTTG